MSTDTDTSVYIYIKIFIYIYLVYSTMAAWMWYDYVLLEDLAQVKPFVKPEWIEQKKAI